MARNRLRHDNVRWLTGRPEAARNLILASGDHHQSVPTLDPGGTLVTACGQLRELVAEYFRVRKQQRAGRQRVEDNKAALALPRGMDPSERMDFAVLWIDGQRRTYLL